MQRAVHGRRSIGRRAGSPSPSCVERSFISPAAPELSGARLVVSLTMRAVEIIPPLDRSVISADRGSREAWDDLVRIAAEGLRASAGYDRTVIEAALCLLGPRECSLEFKLLRLAAGMCA
ncbi:hypothetical protein [Nocardia alni]|uniref:hypothetical protein n=1 Tax=Nocardia alni TaxID=2815723 RepID=UPI001C227098|nr:hypothetical protein [Nocardia alni]